MLSQASSQGKQPVTHELCAGKQLSSVTAALRACRGRGCGGRLLTHTREVLRCLSDATASNSKDLGTRHLPLTLQGLARS